MSDISDLIRRVNAGEPGAQDALFASAYAELRKAAMNQGKRIGEIAEAVVTAHKLMGGA